MSSANNLEPNEGRTEYYTADDSYLGLMCQIAESAISACPPASNDGGELPTKQSDDIQND